MIALIFLFIAFCMTVIIHFSVVFIYDLYHRYVRNIYPFSRKGYIYEK